jgi:hypothetical protein
MRMASRSAVRPSWTETGMREPMISLTDQPGYLPEVSLAEVADVGDELGGKRLVQAVILLEAFLDLGRHAAVLLEGAARNGMRKEEGRHHDDQEDREHFGQAREDIAVTHRGRGQREAR